VSERPENGPPDIGAGRLARYVCDLCERTIGKNDRFVVDVAIRAAGGPMEIDREDLEKDHAAEMRRLLDQMENLPTSELEDGVYRTWSFDLCGKCQRKFMRDPLMRALRRTSPGA